PPPWAPRPPSIRPSATRAVIRPGLFPITIHIRYISTSRLYRLRSKRPSTPRTPEKAGLRPSATHHLRVISEARCRTPEARIGLHPPHTRRPRPAITAGRQETTAPTSRREDSFEQVNSAHRLGGLDVAEPGHGRTPGGDSAVLLPAAGHRVLLAGRDRPGRRRRHGLGRRPVGPPAQPGLQARSPPRSVRGSAVHPHRPPGADLRRTAAVAVHRGRAAARGHAGVAGDRVALARVRAAAGALPRQERHDGRVHVLP